MAYYKMDLTGGISTNTQTWALNSEIGHKRSVKKENHNPRVKGKIYRALMYMVLKLMVFSRCSLKFDVFIPRKTMGFRRFWTFPIYKSLTKIPLSDKSHDSTGVVSPFYLISYHYPHNHGEFLILDCSILFLFEPPQKMESLPPSNKHPLETVV